MNQWLFRHSDQLVTEASEIQGQGLPTAY